MNFGGLPYMKVEEILLIGECAYLHHTGIDHLHERNTRADLIAFLYRPHAPLLPDCGHHDHAIEGRTNQHHFGVGLGVLHNLGGPITLDFQKTDGRRRCLAL